MQCAIAIALTLLASPAVAQRQCWPHETAVELFAQIGESRQSIGLAANGQIMEMFANLETGAWTATMTTPAGLTCIAAHGDAFSHLADPLPNTDDPA